MSKHAVDVHRVSVDQTAADTAVRLAMVSGLGAAFPCHGGGDPRTAATESGMTFLSEPADSPSVRAKYDADLASYGFVMNLTHVWAHLPEAHTRLFELQELLMGSFSMRERGILVTAAASAYGDSYCSFAWSWKLSKESDHEVATAVLAGTDRGLTRQEAALAAWARRVARGPSATTQADVDALRDAGWSDEEIFRATTFVAVRMAFSTVNAALGARPDAELAALAPPAVGELVTWGRPIEQP